VTKPHHLREWCVIFQHNTCKTLWLHD